MKFYLIRHSVREDQEDAEHEEDPELSKEGRKIARRLGDWMARKDEVPTVLIASPSRRAQETAEEIAAAIEEAGYAPPKVETDYTIGPDMSIRGLVLSAAADQSMSRVGIVSHHETLEHGLRVLGSEPDVHHDIFAEGELRAFRVKRKNGKWEELWRVQPSDLDGTDNY